MKKKRRNNDVKKFTIIAIFSIVITLFLSYHVANLLFGVNSYEVLNSLMNKKEYLRKEIIRLQQDNARLQKEYFELKNLEPEE